MFILLEVHCASWIYSFSLSLRNFQTVFKKYILLSLFSSGTTSICMLVHLEVSLILLRLCSLLFFFFISLFLRSHDFCWLFSSVLLLSSARLNLLSILSSKFVISVIVLFNSRIPTWFFFNSFSLLIGIMPSLNSLCTAWVLWTHFHCFEVLAKSTTWAPSKPWFTYYVWVTRSCFSACLRGFCWKKIL